MGNCQLIISREKSFVGSALTYSVELDGILIGKLKNGQMLSINIASGSHILNFISRGRLDKSLLLNVQESNTPTHLQIHPNMKGTLDVESISQDFTSTINEVSTPSQRNNQVAGIVACILIAAFVIPAVFFFSSSNDSNLPVSKSQMEEMSPEEIAQASLDQATQKFESGDYVSAIEICRAIVAQYPETEVSKRMQNYLGRQYVKFPRYDAVHLMSEYEQNIVNADQQYTGKAMIVSGTVTDIGKTNGGSNLTVLLESGEVFWGVQLNFNESQADSVSNVNKGDPITVIGRCTGTSGKMLVVFDGNNVMIEDCYII